MKAIVLVLSSLLAAASAAAAEAERSVPVLVGGNGDLDACLSMAEVSGVRTSLAVRSGPGVSYPQRDALKQGSHVHVCDGPSNALWTPIVYAPAGSDGDCGVSHPIPAKGPYRGACKTGWVRSRWLSVVAG